MQYMLGPMHTICALPVRISRSPSSVEVHTSVEEQYDAVSSTAMLASLCRISTEGRIAWPRFPHKRLNRGES